RTMDDDGWHALRDLYLHTGATASTVASLERKGLVELSERTIYRKPVPPTAGSLNDEPPPLTTAQAAALREISDALQSLKGKEEAEKGNEEADNSKLKTQ